ncbi:MAG: hypothetical protein IPK72_08965 [Candidatus Eisenbacteria bacterium]|nr:hypothetical protein [Candidatus Eisenbacteria bacterium]
MIPGTVEALALNGAYEYACVGPLGFHVLDVSDPTAPTLITTIDTPGFANAAEVAGGRLYLLDGSGGLRIYDLSNPANPGLLKTVALPGTTRDLGLYGGFVYVSAREGGLHVVDVAPVGSAFLVRTLSGYAWEVEAGAAGLFVSYANLSTPETPLLVDTFARSGMGTVSLSGEVLYVPHTGGSQWCRSPIRSTSSTCARFPSAGSLTSRRKGRSWSPGESNRRFSSSTFPIRSFRL